MNRELRYDVVVIGAGSAGLVAGIRLAQAGASVCVIAKGYGCTHLAPGTIDVLGYAPGRVDSPQLGRVDSPGAVLSEFAATRPDHPYALLGAGLVAEAIDWFAAAAARGPFPGYGYSGSLDRNVLLPTAAGALKPSALIPETFAAGDSRQLGRVVIVGTEELRDFHPKLCAANLRAAGIDARALSVDIECDRADSSTLAFARRLDDRAGRAAFAGRLAPLVRAADQVGLPAMLGLRDPHAVLTDLEARLGRRVFEIPSLPPSVPGMRLYEILRDALRRAGGRLVLGAGVIGHRNAGARIASIATDTAGSHTTYAADAFVFAAGGFHSGALALDSRWRARDQVLGLPLHGAPPPGEPRFLASYFDEQPLARAGVAVDGDLRSTGAGNVVVAGASLPGAVPWREGSGEGIALASGYRAAQVIAADLGAAGLGARKADPSPAAPPTPAKPAGVGAENLT
ncbi:MAG: anaerobic glycerol-3-phosphate dehydrogenase subunit GlpB [Conexibacteraceae bacterium]|nr:anaerobic glycerol-3-phosphate dehydrogenase subunit GlpB [Conexibacteraceae bacterium]